MAKRKKPKAKPPANPWLSTAPYFLEIGREIALAQNTIMGAFEEDADGTLVLLNCRSHASHIITLIDNILKVTSDNAKTGTHHGRTADA